MRTDMFEVVTDRSRLHRDASQERKGRAPRDLDDLPSREGMRAGRRRGWNRKRFNGHWKPLRRFLEASVGRSWAEVYSEICANLYGDRRVSERIRDYVGWQVVTRIQRDAAGSPVEFCRWSGTSPLCYEQLYVDEAGILRQMPKAPPQEKPVDPDLVVVSADLEYRRITGLWFEIRLAEVPLPPPPTPIYDEEGRLVRVENHVTRVWDAVENWYVTRYHNETWRAKRYVVAKRPLGSKELRRLRLVNDPDYKPQPKKGARR
jgi:hypothetical protein